MHAQLDEFFRTIRFIKSPVTSDQLKSLPEYVHTVQFDGPLTEQEHQNLAQFLKLYPNVSLRVYGHHGQKQANDLNFLRHYPFLKRFICDVFELENTVGTKYLSEDLSKFNFGQTKKRFSLKFLERFGKLQELYLEGHSKDIEVIAKLKNLEDLSLRSVTLEDLSIFAALKKIWRFELKLGGSRDLKGLAEMENLKYLELWRIRGLVDISEISALKKLQFLFLQDLKHVKELPDFSQCHDLTRIHLENLSGLSDLSPLLKATNLRDLIVRSCPNLQVNDFACLKNHPALKTVAIGLGSSKKNEAIAEMLGLPQTEDSSKFNFIFV